MDFINFRYFRSRILETCCPLWHRGPVPTETFARSQLAATSIFMISMGFHRFHDILWVFTDFYGISQYSQIFTDFRYFKGRILETCCTLWHRGPASIETFARSQLAAISSIFTDFNEISLISSYFHGFHGLAGWLAAGCWLGWGGRGGGEEGGWWRGLEEIPTRSSLEDLGGFPDNPQYSLLNWWLGWECGKQQPPEPGRHFVALGCARGACRVSEQRYALGGPYLLSLAPGGRIFIFWIFLIFGCSGFES